MILKALLLLPLLVYLPGAALAWHLCRRRLPVHEALLLHLLLGFLLCGLVMTALFALGVFSLPLLLGVQGLVFGVAALPALRREGATPMAWLRMRWERQRPGPAVALALTIALALVAFQRPSEWVLSYGMDAANYMVQSAYYAHGDSLFLEDAQQDAYREFFPNAKYNLNSTTRFPPVAEGARELPFPPLWKMMLTLFNLAGGIALSLYASLCFGLLGGLTFAGLFRRLTGSGFYGWFAGAALLLSPPLLNYLRLPMSEVFTLYLVVGALWLLLLAQEGRHGERGPLAGAAGVVLGCLPLVRADGVLLYAGAVLGMGYFAFGSRDAAHRETALPFGGALVLVTPAAWLLSLYAAPRYIRGTIGGEGREVISGALVAVALLYFTLRLLQARGFRAMNWLPRLDSPLLFRGLACGVGAYLAALLMLAYGAPPWVKGALTIAAARYFGFALDLREVFPQGLVTYITPACVLLGIAGSTLALYLRRPGAVFFLATFGIGTLIYFYHPYHSVSTYWFIRRYLYTVLPFLLGGMVFLFAELERLLPRGVPARYLRGAAVILVAGSYLHFAAATGYQRVDFAGAVAALERFSGRFGEQDLVVVDGAMRRADAVQLGLRYLYRREALAPYFDTVSDEELTRFVRAAQGRQRGVFVLYTDPKTERRLRRLFHGEPEPAEIAYRTLAKGGAAEDALRFNVLHLLAPRAAAPN